MKDVSQPRTDVDEIKNSDKLVKLHTGLQSSAVFNWLLSNLKEKAEKLQYFKGKKSLSSKKYQKVREYKKTGKKRKFPLKMSY